MIGNFIDKIGDWNPQLMREIQGRLKIVPVAITFFLSFLTQLVIFLYQLREFPGDKYPLSGTYCLEYSVYQQQLKQIYQKIDQLNREIAFLKNTKNLERVSEITQQLTQLHAQQQQIDNYLYRNQFCPLDRINIQLWWQDHWYYIFISLSIVFVFTLLVAGTYLLINNLAQEEHRGTLNFLRLSPQSEATILIGKMLGVPILVYLAIAIAIPLHLWAARSAHLSWGHIFGFYIVLIASCCFFYSAALLFSFFSFFWNGLEPFLGSGAVLIFLIVTTNLAYFNNLINTAIDWLILLSPSIIFWEKFLLLENLQFFYFPVGKNLLGLLAIHLLNYGLWTYWIWQGLKRVFQKPNAILLSKSQSYLLTICLQVMVYGFTFQNFKSYCRDDFYAVSLCPYNVYYNISFEIENNLTLILLLNTVFLLGLIFVISPRRQAVLDWARYRHQNISNSRLVRRNIWWQDWIWFEKSPSVVAMAINLIITTIPLLILIVVAAILNWNVWLNKIEQDKAILAVAFYITWMMIYATLAQRMLLLKTPKRSLWAIAIIATVIFLPTILLEVLGIEPSKAPILWLFSTFPWSAFEYSTTPTIFIALFVQLSILILLNLELLRQVRLLAESATKALLAKR